MEVVVKNIINIFTVKDGEIYLLLNNNDYIKIECFDEFDIVNSNYIKKNINIKELNLRQIHTFSKKEDNILMITVLYGDIINIDNIKLKGNFNFIEVEKLDRFDDYVSKSLEFIKKELILNSSIKKIYSGEFTLPEIQKIYEFILKKKLDRRNFRKRLIKLDVIEDLDKFSISKNGRPAKLYKFKEIKEDKLLF